MNTMYELAAQYNELFEMCLDDDIDLEVLNDTIEGIEGEIEIKADGYAMVIKELISKADAIDEEIKRLTERKKMFQNNADRVKKSLEYYMTQMDKKKIKTTMFSFSIQNNPPSLQLNEGIDWMDIPEEYLQPQDPKIDKTAIKEAIKAGKNIEFARLVSSESLRIK